MMKYINQGFDNNLCGQTSLAMIANVSIDEACKAIGKRGLTETKDLVRGLMKLQVGFNECRLKILKRNINLPKFALLLMRPIKKQKKYWGHWAVLKDGKIYDPADYHDGPLSIQEYVTTVSSYNIKISSFLELKDTTVKLEPI